MRTFVLHLNSLLVKPALFVDRIQGPKVSEAGLVRRCKWLRLQRDLDSVPNARLRLHLHEVSDAEL